MSAASDFAERYYRETAARFFDMPTHVYGVSMAEIREVRNLADEQGVTVEQWIAQYKLLRYGENYKQLAAWRKHFGILADLAEGRV